MEQDILKTKKDYENNRGVIMNYNGAAYDNSGAIASALGENVCLYILIEFFFI